MNREEEALQLLADPTLSTSSLTDVFLTFLTRPAPRAGRPLFAHASATQAQIVEWLSALSSPLCTWDTTPCLDGLRENPNLPLWFLADPYWLDRLPPSALKPLLNDTAFARAWMRPLWQAASRSPSREPLRSWLVRSVAGSRGGSLYFLWLKAQRESFGAPSLEWFFTGLEMTVRNESLTKHPDYAWIFQQAMASKE